AAGPANASRLHSGPPGGRPSRRPCANRPGAVGTPASLASQRGDGCPRPGDAARRGPAFLGQSMLILGLNALHADASAALWCDGELVAAAEEERFTRVKHASGLPVEAMRWVVEDAGRRPEDLDLCA